jgi:hypothetical protein
LYLVIGVISLCRDLPNKATNDFYKVRKLWQDLNSPAEAWAFIGLGRVALLLTNREEARQLFQQALSLTKPTGWPPWQRPFVETLSGLEESYDNVAAFHTLCRHLQGEHLDLLVGGSVLSLSGKRITNRFVQWFLEPAQPQVSLLMADYELNGVEVQDLKTRIGSGEWTWHDPFSDCSFTLLRGLEIQAANGRDLFHVNRSAPHLLRSAQGDFAIQAICLPVSDEKPAQGGVLLWHDSTNYLRLDRGTFGKHEITFLGCIDNNDVVIGRGRLPAERVFLRLERIGERVNALCSADGEQWFTVGQVNFPVDDPVEVGLHAIGMIDRLIYPGAYPEGTAIRFESFSIYK